MFTTIVLATDGSEGAERAGQVAVDLARQSRAKLVLAHIDERIAAKGDEAPLLPNEQRIQAEIKAEAEALSSEGVEATVEMGSVVLGGPGPAICEIADRVGADLIVTGTRGHSSLVGILVGSVTHKLLHVSKRPVLAVPSTD
jgi:nucleotide-binding universal stress UspA family protein